MDNTSGWSKQEKFVLEGMEHLRENQKEIFGKLDTIIVDIATLKVKAGIWGLIGGMIPVGIMLIVLLIKGLIK